MERRTELWLPSSVTVSPPPPRTPSRWRRIFSKTFGNKWFIGFLSFVLGTVSGLAVDLARLLVPVNDIADIGADYVHPTVLLERHQNIHGGLWVFPFLVSGRPDVERLVLGPIDDREVTDQDFRNAGAIDPNVTIAKLIVEGERNNPVRIVGMRAVVESKGEPLADGATLLGPGPEGAGHSMQVGFDPDSDNPIAVEITDDTYAEVFGPDFFTTTPAFNRQTVELAKGERHVFQVIARTLTKHVRWRIELALVDDGEQRTVVADLGGKPLETTALVNGADDAFIAPDASEYGEVYDWYVGSDENAFRYARTK